LVAGLGNAIETALWWFHGGMPSDWIVKPAPNILSASQISRLESHVRSRLDIELQTVRGLDRKSWWPVGRQIYADVMKHGKPQRIDTFNGNYGLNRGLSASTIFLCIIALVEKEWWVAIGLLAASAVYLYRARRFGIHYARTLRPIFAFASVGKCEQASKPKETTIARRVTEKSEWQLTPK